MVRRASTYWLLFKANETIGGKHLQVVALGAGPTC